MKGALNIRKLFQLEKEYIEERYSKSKRLRNLLKIWQMDRTMESFSLNENADPKCNQKESSSLTDSLKVAELDSSRTFDSKDVKSSELFMEFLPATEIKGNEDYIPEFSYDYKDVNSDMTVRIEREFDIHFPENLNVYSYDVENDEPFDSPQRDDTEVYNSYLMDGGSLLPVLALDLKPNNTFLDLCAAPGGKSMLALQTLYPSTITSNDCTKSRVDRLYNVYRQFLFDFDKTFLNDGRVVISQKDGRSFENACYDRVLVSES